MTYTQNIVIPLSSYQAGLTLNAQLMDATGADYGVPIASGFYEVGNGLYLWYCTGLPDSFEGSVRFYDSAVPGMPLAGAPIANCCLAQPEPTAYDFAYTVTNSVTHAPIEGAEIWITTDLAGANTIWYGYSDVFGVARDINGHKPVLSPGTYYFWVRHNGFITDAWPDTEAQP